ncbi:HrpE/YscL family type III secretion apparatus protein [Robbsia andropogonis]|uniref:HrpE/YscL family type III secretion apparatus protein n=1 Tax=Robbsia andropogonis TaxID=28092 RepID=UPI00046306E9|nr:HrpE/YscL family type III secretion apparatus protein [Robbsia andropogonis]MCP1117110.1 HrpE/YscL family type III secretion apparatus protein [Robbsia andropogonis]MCP1128456.1 HrpE/YscL family type III secretion apparatus protein [Robbsia andropogonis]
MAFHIRHVAVTPQQASVHLTPGTRVVKASASAAYVAADRLLAEATRKAQAIIDDAQRAHDEESARGYAEGRETAQLEQAERMIENVGRAIDYFARVERDAVDLVMSAVTRIIDDFDDLAKVTMVVRSALAAVRNQKQVLLRVHPEQAASVRSRLDTILSGFPSVGFVDVVADGRLGHHACILETDIGMVDTSLDGQLTAIRNALGAVLGERSERDGHARPARRLTRGEDVHARGSED